MSTIATTIAELRVLTGYPGEKGQGATAAAAKVEELYVEPEGAFVKAGCLVIMPGKRCVPKNRKIVLCNNASLGEIVLERQTDRKA